MFVSFLQVRFYPRTCNLDNAFAVNVKLPAPAFLVNVFRCLLLVYCADSRVVFFSLERTDVNPSKSQCLAWDQDPWWGEKEMFYNTVFFQMFRKCKFHACKKYHQSITCHIPQQLFMSRLHLYMQVSHTNRESNRTQQNKSLLTELKVYVLRTFDALTVSCPVLFGSKFLHWFPFLPKSSMKSWKTFEEMSSHANGFVNARSPATEKPLLVGQNKCYALSFFLLEIMKWQLIS